jgi:hypothetical protein
MCHKHHLESLDRLLKDLCNGALPFGGKVVLLGGDSRQTLPVAHKSTPAQQANASILASPTFQHFRASTFHLTTNMRVQQMQSVGNRTDSERLDSFANWLLHLGNGTLPVDNTNSVEMPNELCADADVEAMMDFAYPDLERNCHKPEWIAERAILTTLNRNVDKINEKLTRQFKGTAVDCISANQALDNGELDAPEEYLHTLAPSGMPPHKLTIKKRMPLMLLRNIDPSAGLCNGTKLLAEEILDGRILVASICSGNPKFIGTKVILPRMLFKGDEKRHGFNWSRRQFPVRPAFALTINKSQGQTLKRAAIYLPDPVFSHGQLYVAASRVGDPRNLRFFLPSSMQTDGSWRVRNVVYPEALSN